MFQTIKINEADVPFVQVNNRLIRSITLHALMQGSALIGTEDNGDVFRIMQWDMRILK
jgi:hypothetical protein